jgi:hypothetical protein
LKVLPRLLAPLVDGHRPDEDVVGQVRSRLRSAPEGLLLHPLPDPATAVTQLALERRTAAALRRWAATEPVSGPWTVGRYLSVAGFGACALVDLLGALEAQGGRIG